MTKRYHVVSTFVRDETTGQMLCYCHEESVAQRIAQALDHLVAYEEEQRPLTAEELEHLTRGLAQFNAQYDAEHPEFDPDRLARTLGMK